MQIGMQPVISVACGVIVPPVLTTAVVTAVDASSVGVDCEAVDATVAAVGTNPVVPVVVTGTLPIDCDCVVIVVGVVVLAVLHTSISEFRNFKIFALFNVNIKKE